MSVARFNFNFRHSRSFLFEDLEPGDVPKTGKVLKITFPDGNRLEFSEHHSMFPSSFDELGDNGESGNHILEDMDEWGYSATGNTLMVDIETLKQDLELHPNLFVNIHGEIIPFDYRVFPDGLYKVEFSFAPPMVYAPDVELPSEDPEGPVSTPYSDTDYVLNDYGLKEEVSKQSDIYDEMRRHIDTEHSIDDIRRYRDYIMKLLILLKTARYNLEKHSYSRSQKNMDAANRLVELGINNYNTW